MQLVSLCRRNRLVAAALTATLAFAAVAPTSAWAQDAEGDEETAPDETTDDLDAEDRTSDDADDGSGEGGEAPADDGEDGEDGDDATGGEQPTEGIDDEDDGAVDPAVTCDAELVVDEGDEFYWFEPGQAVECVAEGLDPAVDAEWGVEIYAATFDDLDDDSVFDEPSEIHGEIVTPAEDGTITFGFTVPADVLFAEVLGFVAQGEPGEETYLVEFMGVALGDLEFTIGAMDCPDPVTAGTVATCTAADMTPGEFHYGVQFFSVREIVDAIRDLEDLLDELELDLDEGLLAEEDLLFGEPDVLGVGEAGQDGLGRFEFAIPSSRALDFYVAVAFQETGYLAISAGEIVPAGVGNGGNGGTGTGGAGGPSTGGAAPVAVPRPNRVEAGAGGAADGATSLVALAGLAGVCALVLRRRLAGR